MSRQQLVSGVGPVGIVIGSGGADSYAAFMDHTTSWGIEAEEAQTPVHDSNGDVTESFAGPMTATMTVTCKDFPDELIGRLAGDTVTAIASAAARSIGSVQDIVGDKLKAVIEGAEPSSNLPLGLHFIGVKIEGAERSWVILDESGRPREGIADPFGGTAPPATALVTDLAAFVVNPQNAGGVKIGVGAATRKRPFAKVIALSDFRQGNKVNLIEASAAKLSSRPAQNTAATGEVAEKPLVLLLHHNVADGGTYTNTSLLGE